MVSELYGLDWCKIRLFFMLAYVIVVEIVEFLIIFFLKFWSLH